MTSIPPNNTAEISTTPTCEPTKPARRDVMSAWIVLAAGLLLTVAATLFMNASVEKRAEREFTSRCSEMEQAIADKLDAHARILMSGAALFNASEMVTRAKWHIFTERQKVKTQRLDFQAMGFALLIPREKLARHIQGIRGEGFPEYQVHPVDDRELYSSIIYLEPFSRQNQRGFGYDMFSEPTRREAMERARDRDAIAISGKVVLVQETSSDSHPAILMYVPVYRNDMPHETVEERRAAIYGWVYGAYRMNELMQGILGARELEKEKQLHVEIFDGEQPSPRSLLYENHPAGEQKRWPEVRLTRQIPFDFSGYRWTLRFTQNGGGFSSVGYISVWLTMVCGTLITLLLFALVRALLNTRAKAQFIAENLTEEIAQLVNEQRIILNTMPIGAFFLKGRKIHLSNPAFDLIFGYEIGTTKGMKVSAFYLDIATCERVENEADAAIAGGGIHSVEVQMKTKDGALIWCSMVGRAVNAAKPGDGAIWMIQDITERKRSEEELYRYREHLEELVTERTQKLEVANERLMELDRLKSLFIASMSHELRTPLNSVIGFSSILLNEWIGPLNDEQKQSLTSVLRSGKHLLSLINDVIDVSKIEAGTIEVVSDDFELAELLAEVEENLAKEAQDRGLSLTVESFRLALHTDRRRLLQCLLNLVSNAIKFTEQGGVTVAARHDQEQGEVTIAVTDTGIGIAAEDQTRLFQAFSRIPSPISTRVPGTGLGLYLTQKIVVEFLHGTISVTSEPGSGSTFRISIPSRLECSLNHESAQR